MPFVTSQEDGIQERVFQQGTASKIHKRWTLRNVCCHARENNNDILIMCLLIVFYSCFFTNFSDDADHVKHGTPST